MIRVVNPYSGDELAKLNFATSDGLAKILQTSQEAFRKWRTSTAWSRSQLLLHAADKLETQKEDFAALICREAGKPLTYARMEIQRALGVLRWAASEAQRDAGELLRLDATANGRQGFGIHTKFPRGPVLGITPFNFPLNLVIHKIAPAIAAGCSIVIKPSPATPLTARKCAELFSEIPGLVQVALADDQQTAELTRVPEIKTISFTGSARVGWLIRQQAPEKPTTLELGGNAWVVILEDTPRSLLPTIAKRVAGAAYGYAGQSCISVQNVAVNATMFEEFSEALSEATRVTPYGDPSLESVISGPVIHTQAARKIQAELAKGPAEFRRVTSQSCQGTLTTPDACEGLVAPTLLIAGPGPEESQKAAASTIMQEEIFGPVMTLTGFESLDHIIHTVNSSRYGLQTGIYTQHWPNIERLYRELEVGGVVINDVPTTRYDHQPYGGVKDSGLGREGIRYAMDEMSESKFLALSSQIPL